MAKELIIEKAARKQEKYLALLPQLMALVEDEKNPIANMANISAALKETFAFFWAGFYIVDGQELVLGPFQGPIACTRISYGKGVCGTSWEKNETIVVPDVAQFPGHIACNSASRSEIVIPGSGTDGKVQFVLDVDSDELNAFDATDQHFLEQIVGLLG